MRFVIGWNTDQRKKANISPFSVVSFQAHGKEDILVDYEVAYLKA